MEEAGAFRSPSEVIKIRRLTCSVPASLEGRPTTESGVNAPLVVIGSESNQLAMQIEAVPEEGLVERLAPKRSDQSLDERMRARPFRPEIETTCSGSDAVAIAMEVGTLPLSGLLQPVSTLFGVPVSRGSTHFADVM